jgi:hypothetical protein
MDTEPRKEGSKLAPLALFISAAMVFPGGVSLPAEAQNASQELTTLNVVEKTKQESSIGVANTVQQLGAEFNYEVITEASNIPINQLIELIRAGKARLMNKPYFSFRNGQIWVHGVVSISGSLASSGIRQESNSLRPLEGRIIGETFNIEDFGTYSLFGSKIFNAAMSDIGSAVYLRHDGKYMFFGIIASPVLKEPEHESVRVWMIRNGRRAELVMLVYLPGNVIGVFEAEPYSQDGTQYFSLEQIKGWDPNLYGFFRQNRGWSLSNFDD